jgi:hypothetical protein
MALTKKQLQDYKEYFESQPLFPFYAGGERYYPGTGKNIIGFMDSMGKCRKIKHITSEGCDLFSLDDIDD